MNNTYLNLLIIVIIAYILFGLFLYIFQNSLIYYPTNQDFYNCPGFHSYEAKNMNGTRFYLKEQSEDVIIHYHGNAGSTCDRSTIKEYFETSNKSLIFVEYAGYSNDPRSPNKELIKKDVENIQKFAEEKYNKIYVYGQSIGTGAASYHAKTGRADKLILTTGFSSLKEVAQSKYRIYPASLLLKENYDNKKWLEDYKGDVVFFHGDKDNIIPHRFSKELYESLNTNKKYHLIEGKGHNNIWNSKTFREKLKDELSK